jgi:hypothetical protein
MAQALAGKYSEARTTRTRCRAAQTRPLARMRLPRLRVGFQPLIVLVASIIGILPATPNFLRLTFDSGLQSHERVIPLLPDEVERTACLFQPRAFKLPQALASHFDVAHQARSSQDMQVLRDRLACDVGSGCELCDRHRAFGA